MEVVDFKLEVAQVTIAERFPLDDFNLVVCPLHFGGGDAEAEVVEDAVGMTSQLPGEASQERDPRAEGGFDPVLKMPLGLFDRCQPPEVPQVLTA